MKNIQKIGIAVAILAVVIVIAVVVSGNWYSWLNAFLAWIQGVVGIDDPFQLPEPESDS